MSDKDVIPDVLPEPVTETAAHPVPDEPPEYINTIIEKLDDIGAQVAGSQVEPEHQPEQHDELEHDETPAKLPWTHRKVLGR